MFENQNLNKFVIKRKNGGEGMSMIGKSLYYYLCTVVATVWSYSACV